MRSKRRKTACPACESLKIVLVPLGGQKKFFRCQRCQLEWRVVFPTRAQLEKCYQKDYFSQKGRLTRGYPDYDLLTGSFIKYYSRQLERLKKHCPVGGVLIDVGCGPGIFLHEAKKKGFKVLGVDLSGEAVAICWRRYRIRVLQGGLEKLKLGPPKRGVITCFQTLEHMARPLDFLKRAYQILQPQGLLLLTTPDAGCFWRKLLGKRWFSYQHQEHLYFWQKKPLRLALQKVGFRQISFFNDDWRWYNFQELASLMGAYGGKMGQGLARLLPQRGFSWWGWPFPVGSLGVIAKKAGNKKSDA